NQTPAWSSGATGSTVGRGGLSVSVAATRALLWSRRGNLAFARDLVLRREHVSVAMQHVDDRAVDVLRRRGPSRPELAREHLDAELAHPVALQHRRDRDLRTDERAVRVEL